MTRVHPASASSQDQDDHWSVAGHNRPTIELPVGETERIVDAIDDALIASARGLYRRGGLIVSTGASALDDQRRVPGRRATLRVSGASATI